MNAPGRKSIKSKMDSEIAQYAVVIVITLVFVILSTIKTQRVYVKAEITDSVLYNDPKRTKYDKNGNAVYDCKGKFNHFTASFKAKGGYSQTVKVKYPIGCDTKVRKNGHYKMYYTKSTDLEKSLRFATAFDAIPFLALAGVTTGVKIGFVVYKGIQVGKLLKEQDRMSRRYTSAY